MYNSIMLRRMSEKERIEFRRRKADEIFMTLFKNHQLAKQRASEQAKKVEVTAKRLNSIYLQIKASQIQ